MLVLNNMNIHELLSKRFATKRFDSTKKVSAEDLNYILEAGRLSPSSANTQPWKFLVISDLELRKKLQIASYDQPQIIEASHLIVLCTIKDPKIRINKVAEIISQSNPEASEKYLNMVNGWLPSDEISTLAWLKPQLYIALQSMMLAGIEKDIDSCPMEGFDAKQYAEILELEDCIPAVLLPIGYASMPGMPKVRVPLEDIVEYKD